MTLYERYLRWRMTPCGFALWLLLDDVDAWEAGNEFWLTHTKTSIRVWVANGPSHLYVTTRGDEPSKIEVFNSVDKRVLWKKIRSMANRRYANLMMRSLVGE